MEQNISGTVAGLALRTTHRGPMKDTDAATRIRQQLEEHPPNHGARFVDFNLSETGLQITRS